MAVLITRPDERGKQLTEMLNKCGIVAVHLPILTLKAGDGLNNLPQKLERLRNGDYVFAVSKNAVDYADRALKNTGFIWRSDLRYFAVGKYTATHFAESIAQSVR